MIDEVTYLYQSACPHGALLYVGITSNYKRRLSEHASHSGWWSEASLITVRSYPTRAAALRAETWIIKNEHPVWNIHGRVDKFPIGEEYEALVVTALPGAVVIEKQATA
jgi:predicted GIY-YIG superfamily endonuclease